MSSSALKNILVAAVTPSRACACACQLLLSFVLCMSVGEQECSTLRIRNISSLMVTSHCNTSRQRVSKEKDEMRNKREKESEKRRVRAEGGKGGHNKKNVRIVRKQMVQLSQLRSCWVFLAVCIRSLFFIQQSWRAAIRSSCQTKSWLAPFSSYSMTNSFVYLFHTHVIWIKVLLATLWYVLSFCISVALWCSSFALLTTTALHPSFPPSGRLRCVFEPQRRLRGGWRDNFSVIFLSFVLCSELSCALW